ncbi:PKD domain-containing protein [Flavivirga aquimarina]|uniref:PKD domain-containing protein n=1 Tax=Flavivirga aquimarina TaxID=2027862 RepID=A0ABT8W7U5_9FLAO|nr:PKD domain-containing protein [Flavivirga aquimarina]MDO5969190.1 PKD domain-containing protein [Flavivirga aquimarina]
MKTLKYIFSFTLVFLISCAEDDNDLSFIDEVIAPSEVSALFKVTQDNTGEVTITPNATGASNFNINYGDGTEETANVVQGESISHTYEEGSYTVTIEAVGITGLKTEATQNLEVSFKAPENVDVAISNDVAVSKQVNVTANADFAISYDVYFGESGIDDPVSANIGESVSYTYQNAGTYTIRVVVMGAAIATTEYKEDFEVTEILQPIASAPEPPNREETDVISLFSSKYNDVTDTNFFPDWGQGGQGSGWALFDLNGDEMLQYINLSYQGIALADGTSVDVSGMQYLHLDVWTADEGIKIETSLINNAGGNVTEAPVWSDLTSGEWTSIEIPISDYTDQGLTVTEIFQMKFVGDPWATGTVFIDNIYFYKPSTVAEVPEYNAPSPTQNEANVISIFSDSYTNVGISELNPNWGQTTTLTPLDISGNNIWLYEALNFSGIVTDYGNPTDLSAMDYVHFDYFTPDAEVLGLKIVNTVVNEEDIEFVENIVRGTWVSVTIPLSDYAIDASAVTQLIFDTTGGSAKVYIDNLYFYSESSSQPTVSAPSPTIAASDVISIYSDAYTGVTLNEVNPDWGQTTTLSDFNISGDNIWLYQSLNYSGIVTDYGNPTDLTGVKYLHFDYYTPDATTLGFKIVNTALNPVQEDIIFLSEILTGTWVSVTIPLSDYNLDFANITQLIWDTSGGSATVYVDNIYFHN